MRDEADFFAKEGQISSMRPTDKNISSVSNR